MDPQIKSFSLFDIVVAPNSSLDFPIWKYKLKKEIRDGVYLNKEMSHLSNNLNYLEEMV